MPPIPILIALADPTRCRIIELLTAGPQPVHVLAEAFSISRPAISRHLRVLKQAKLISEKKSGRENIYRLQPKCLKPVQAWIETVLVKPQARSSAKAHSPASSHPVMTPKAPSISQMGFDF